MAAHTAADKPQHDALFEQRYAAISARDTRFDGQFFTAVKTTKIYCKPSCPARTPKPENVTFYVTSAAAHEAGYRACKRCLPEATAGTPEWNIRQDLAARAMRLIADGIVDRHNVEGLAHHLGFSARHVNRTLIQELGASPIALARARRAQLARNLLVGTDLPIADVAFASGFGSIRQFNDTIRDVFDTTPTHMRARTHHTEAHTTTGQATTLTIALPVRLPFHARGVVEFLAARALPGIEYAQLDDPQHLIYARTLALPHGPAACEIHFTATPQKPDDWTVTAQLELSSLHDLSTAVSRIRRLLDLDADAQAVHEALNSDPHLAPAVHATPGMRVPGAVDPEELVIRAIIGQQISVVAARKHLTRLATQAGAPYTSKFHGLERLFPTPARIVAAVPHIQPDEQLDPERALRLPRRTSNTVRNAATHLSSGDLNIHVGVEPETLQTALTALPGIGTWTAAYVTLRVLGHPDTWMSGDVALVAGAKKLGILSDEHTRSSPADHRNLAAHAEKWAPWRSYASMYMWQAAAQHHLKDEA
ncbi:AlkA N-terminal domain-containing protein [Timonella sp. A28]|uniref:AlkA N-terminal domain-containing protein n=1 Tax=Timonella sp. A28 TaxID=3442640 RepID=UPI003EBBD611